jgi:hypothetical protein
LRAAIDDVREAGRIHELVMEVREDGNAPAVTVELGETDAA